MHWLKILASAKYIMHDGEHIPFVWAVAELYHVRHSGEIEELTFHPQVSLTCVLLSRCSADTAVQQPTQKGYALLLCILMAFALGFSVSAPKILRSSFPMAVIHNSERNAVSKSSS